MEIITVTEKIEESAHHFLHSLKSEYVESKETVFIIHKYIKEGSLTPEEEHALKQGLADSLKTAGVVIPFVLIPGASVLMPILIKVASKHNIKLLPSAFD